MPLEKLSYYRFFKGGRMVENLFNINVNEIIEQVSHRSVKKSYKILKGGYNVYPIQ